MEKMVCIESIGAIHSFLHCDKVVAKKLPSEWAIRLFLKDDTYIATIYAEHYRVISRKQLKINLEDL